MLGVHPNTVRAWSDAGRLRYYRINPRGDRRYRLGDLQRFLAGADSHGAASQRERLRRRADLATVTALARIAGDPETLDEALRQTTLTIRERGGFRSVAIHELRGDRLVPRATTTSSGRLPDLPR